MASAALDYSPSYGSPKKITPRVKQVAFGDGYIQRGADGINLFPMIWDLIFANRTDVEAAAIEVVFRAAAGGTLLWKIPSPTISTDPYITWVVNNWSRIPVNFNVNTINCTLQQVFE